MSPDGPHRNADGYRLRDGGRQGLGGKPDQAPDRGRQDNFTFRPAFKLFIVGNHKPDLNSVDDAMRRRLRIVPFDRRPAHSDRLLEEKLQSEWPGILRWMIEGCLDWQQSGGLAMPRRITEATEDYFAEQDLFGQWLDEACDVEPDNRAKLASTSELFRCWSDYAKAAGGQAGTTKTFASAMRQRGLRKHRSNNLRGYRGVRLRPAHGRGNASDTS